MGRNAYRGTVIGGAVDDRLIQADGRQIQNCVGAGQENSRPCVSSPAAQVGDHHLLGSLVQVVLDHVDDHGTWVFRFKADKQSDKGI